MLLLLLLQGRETAPPPAAICASYQQRDKAGGAAHTPVHTHKHAHLRLSSVFVKKLSVFSLESVSSENLWQSKSDIPVPQSAV